MGEALWKLLRKIWNGEEIAEDWKEGIICFKGSRIRTEQGKDQNGSFRKKSNKRRQRTWKWEELQLEEVDEIRYLGYILQKNGSDEKHIQDRKKRAIIAMKKTWSVGERIFKQDYKMRMEHW